jgi:hypothetical protein
MLLLMAATTAISFSIQAQFADRRAVDAPVRLALAALALVVIFHPEERISALTCIPIGLIIGYWVLRRRNVALTTPSGAARRNA